MEETSGRATEEGSLFQDGHTCNRCRVYLACPARRRPQGRPRTRWNDYVTFLAWERLGILPVELEEVSGEREV